MRIFITGATGFIGTHLVRRLAQTEHELVCLARETSEVDELHRLGVTLVTGDVTDKDSVLQGMRARQGFTASRGIALSAKILRLVRIGSASISEPSTRVI